MPPPTFPARRKPFSGTSMTSRPSTASEISSRSLDTFVLKSQKCDWKCLISAEPVSSCAFSRTFLPKLNDCETDDDVAMCFLRNKAGFEKYLQYLVGQSQAESAVSDKTVHRFFKVPSQMCWFFFWEKHFSFSIIHFFQVILCSEVFEAENGLPYFSFGSSCYN